MKFWRQWFFCSLLQTGFLGSTLTTIICRLEPILPPLSHNSHIVNRLSVRHWRISLLIVSPSSRTSERYVLTLFTENKEKTLYVGSPLCLNFGVCYTLPRPEPYNIVEKRKRCGKRGLCWDLVFFNSFYVKVGTHLNSLWSIYLRILASHRSKIRHPEVQLKLEHFLSWSPVETVNMKTKRLEHVYTSSYLLNPSSKLVREKSLNVLTRKRP